MRYLTLAEIVELHRRILQVTDGATRIRDLGTLEEFTDWLQQHLKPLK